MRNYSLEYAALLVSSSIELCACVALIIFGHETAGWWLLGISMFCTTGCAFEIRQARKG